MIASVHGKQGLLAQGTGLVPNLLDSRTPRARTAKTQTPRPRSSVEGIAGPTDPESAEENTMELRPLGNTDLRVSPVALGCWPIAGMTSGPVPETQSLATIRACFDLGINHLDTAYMYGPNGESERLIARAIDGRRDEMVIATKGGLHWDARGKQAHDASPAALRRECEESLRRLGTDRVELYYVHAPDDNVPIAETAGAMNKPVASQAVAIQKIASCVCHVRVTE